MALTPSPELEGPFLGEEAVIYSGDEAVSTAVMYFFLHRHINQRFVKQRISSMQETGKVNQIAGNERSLGK